jgi:ubiquinone biosynthesis protein COQ9
MTKKNDDKTPDELRDSLLTAALNHVAFDGWSNATLRQAEKDLNLDKGMVFLSFPGGAIDMIDFLAEKCDQRMIKQSQKFKLEKLKIREKITTLVKLRIEVEHSHKEAVHRTLPYLALPQNHFRSLKMLYRTVDLMWKTISDTSTDFNFYTKRMTLAGVYSSTFLYWISDETEDCIDTWKFLDRRIENVMQIEKAKAKFREKEINFSNIWRTLGRKRYGS